MNRSSSACRNALRASFAVLFLCLAPIAGAQVADTVYRNGKIYTMNLKQPWAEAVAIVNDRFVFVGTNKEVEERIGEASKVVDVKGSLVIPGMYDMHVHPDLLFEPKYTGQIQTPPLGPKELQEAIL